MRNRTSKAPPREIPQGVRRGELLPLSCLMQRLGVGRKTVWELERQGLVGVTVGHQKYFLGDDVLDTFARLAAEEREAAGAEKDPAEQTNQAKG